jgi:hypothetical protein
VIRKDAIQSDFPDLMALYDDYYGGHRPVNSDPNERRRLIQEVAEDANRRGAEEDEANAEEADDPDAFDAEQLRDPAKRREAVEGIAQAHIDAPEDEAA